jgi:DNA-binding NarL/FixJ family response regulator
VLIHDMTRAIREAYAGQPTLSPEVTRALIRAQVKTPTPEVGLKERELKVLWRAARRLTNPQIADILSLSVSTIKFYVSKLNMDTRTKTIA